MSDQLSKRYLNTGAAPVSPCASIQAQAAPREYPAIESATTPAEVDGRWITQTAFYDPGKPDACTGNCTESAIASIFGLPLDAVPSFAGKGGGDFWFAVDGFIESMGYEMHMMAGNYQPQGMYLASGPSDRGCSHMVVMQGGKLLHDPHPSRAGIQKVEHVWMLVPKDPAIHATLARQLAESESALAATTRRVAEVEGLVGKWRDEAAGQSGYWVDALRDCADELESALGEPK